MTREKMVLGLIAAAGVGLAGYGIFKGSTAAGRAAERAGRGAEETLHTISREVTELRVFLTETAWPEVNKTMIHVRRVLDSADVLLITSTFTVKVLAFLLCLCAAFVTHKLSSARSVRPWKQRVQRQSLSATIESTVLQMVYCLCLVMAVVLILQLVQDLLNISWPHSVPLIILIPSLATLGVIYQHFMVAIRAIFAFLWFIPYAIIAAPIEMSLSPVAKGSGYMHTTLPLQLAVCVVYFLLYLCVPYGAYLFLAYILPPDQPILKSMVVCYLVFYAASMVVSVLGTLIISGFVRPLWALQAKRY